MAAPASDKGSCLGQLWDEIVNAPKGPTDSYARWPKLYTILFMMVPNIKASHRILWHLNKLFATILQGDFGGAHSPYWILEVGFTVRSLEADCQCSVRPRTYFRCCQLLNTR